MADTVSVVGAYDPNNPNQREARERYQRTQEALAGNQNNDD